MISLSNLFEPVPGSLVCVQVTVNDLRRLSGCFKRVKTTHLVCRAFPLENGRKKSPGAGLKLKLQSEEVDPPLYGKTCSVSEFLPLSPPQKD